MRARTQFELDGVRQATFCTPRLIRKTSRVQNSVFRTRNKIRQNLNVMDVSNVTVYGTDQRGPAIRPKVFCQILTGNAFNGKA